MKLEIGAEAALFPEKEYLNGMAVAVVGTHCSVQTLFCGDTAYAEKTVL
jgi:hypothetical protein